MGPRLTLCAPFGVGSQGDGVEKPWRISKGEGETGWLPCPQRPFYRDVHAVARICVHFQSCELGADWLAACPAKVLQGFKGLILCDPHNNLLGRSFSTSLNSLSLIHI